MSLINEALKRTHDASFQSATAQPMSPDQYRIANHPKRVSIGAGWGIVLAVVVSLLLIAVVIGFLTVHSLLTDRSSGKASTIISTPNRAVEASGSARAASSSTTPIPATTVVPVKDSTAQSEPGTTSSNKTPSVQEAAEAALVDRLLERVKAEQAAAPKPSPSPPKLVLQGVTSQGNLREAMINNVNVREGDDVEGAHVVSIDSRSVKLQFGGQDIVLRMP